MSKYKPTTDPKWAESAAPDDVDAPSAALRAAGYLFRDPLPHDEFNSILQTLGRHVDSLERSTSLFSSVSDALSFLEDGELGYLEQFDDTKNAFSNVDNESLSTGAKVDLNTNGEYLITTEFDSTADNVTYRLFTVDDLSLQWSKTYPHTSAGDRYPCARFAGDTLILVYGDVFAGGAQEYEIYDDPQSGVLSRSNSTAYGPLLANSKDRVYAVDPTDNKKVHAFSLDLSSSYAITTPNTEFTRSGRSRGNVVQSNLYPSPGGLVVLAGKVAPSGVVKHIFTDNGSALSDEGNFVLTSPGSMNASDGGTPMFSFDGRHALEVIQTFNAPDHAYLIQQSPGDGNRNTSASGMDGATLLSSSIYLSDSDNTKARVSQNGVWSCVMLPDDGSYGSVGSRVFVFKDIADLDGHDWTYGAHLDATGGAQWSSHTGGILTGNGQIQSAVLGPRSLFVVVSNSNSASTIQRIQLPGPALVRKGTDNPTGLKLQAVRG